MKRDERKQGNKDDRKEKKKQRKKGIKTMKGSKWEQEE